VGVASKAACPGRLAGDLGGDERTAALERQQLRRVVGNRHGHLALELGVGEC